MNATLLGLPTSDYLIDANMTTEAVKEVFDSRPGLVGAIVVEDGEILEVLSRDALFRHLSRAFFREIFLRRPIREFVEMWCSSVLRLDSDCTINRAAELALARPYGQAFEPILVDYGERVGLLDTQVLLVAQAQLLSLSRAVEEQRNAAEAANRSKSEFLANISHELRTPLHGILSYAKFGMSETTGGEHQELHEFFRNVDRCADNLLQLVNDLLDLSKLEAGRMTFDLAFVDLRELVGMVVDEFRSFCSNQKSAIIFNPPDLPMNVHADSGRVQQVVRNLLSNALKFSPSSGTVTVRLRKVGTTILLSVRDEGPGIPPEEMEDIFDKFVQSSKTKTHSGGTGLGLAICREIMAGHKGRIWVENNEGKGCIFYVEFPWAEHEDRNLAHQADSRVLTDAPSN